MYAIACQFNCDIGELACVTNTLVPDVHEKLFDFSILCMPCYHIDARQCTVITVRQQNTRNSSQET